MNNYIISVGAHMAGESFCRRWHPRVWAECYQPVYFIQFDEVQPTCRQRHSATGGGCSAESGGIQHGGWEICIDYADW